MAKEFTGIICLQTGKVLDSGNDPFCVNHWQDLVIDFDIEKQAETRDECIKLHCCQSIEQLKDWQSKAHMLAEGMVRDAPLPELEIPGPGKVVVISEDTIVVAKPKVSATKRTQKIPGYPPLQDKLTGERKKETTKPRKPKQ